MAYESSLSMERRGYRTCQALSSQSEATIRNPKRTLRAEGCAGLSVVLQKVVGVSGLAGAVLRITLSAGGEHQRVLDWVAVMTLTRFDTKPESSRVADSGLILRSILRIGPESPCDVATFSLE